MKKNITKTTKKTTPAKAVKKAAKKPAKQIPWEERRNEVLAKARAKLRETIAAGKAALENVTEASASKPAFKLNPKLPTLDQLAVMTVSEAAKCGPYSADDDKVTVYPDGKRSKKVVWKSRKAAAFYYAHYMWVVNNYDEYPSVAKLVMQIVRGDAVCGK